MEATNNAPDLAWIAPTHRPAPAEALARVQAICSHCPELFGAMFSVLATHQGVPREILAAAVKQFRPDTEALSRDDVTSLLVAVWNGGKQGFDAVMRTRKSAPRAASAHPWAAE